MRALVALVALASCATTPPLAPDERVAGCWIARGDGGDAVTMRWLPGAAGEVNGDLLRYTSAGAGGRESYVLRQTAIAWTLCETTEGGAGACWAVAQAESGSLEGGRAFSDAHGERLRIAILDGGGERVLFQGRRDGCD